MGINRLSDRDINVKYYEWLLQLVGGDKEYSKLLFALHSEAFLTVSIGNDWNRTMDGLALRERFCDGEGYEFDKSQFSNNCSLLEMIIGLAYRCEFVMSDQIDYGMSNWFWRMLENAKLTDFEDEKYDDNEVCATMHLIIFRKYAKNGKGGLFPLKDEKRDWRTIELWLQMNQYLMENYYI